MSFKGWARFNTPSSFTEQEKNEYEQRKAQREHKAQEAQDEVARCKANALRLIAEQS